MKNAVIIVVLVLIVVGGYLGRHTLKSMFMGSSTPSTENAPTVAPEASSGASGVMTAGTIKTFTVSGNEFAFAPATLTAAKGDTVKVIFTNTGKYPHNFAIDALNVKSKTVDAGGSDTVTFTADKAGTFQYYCSVPTHKDRGMVGTLTVR